jgi:tetratricopeptide (TPR) repeat protein
MKPISSTAIALVFALSAAPAAAQSGSYNPPGQAQQSAIQQREQEQQEAKPAANQPKINVSAKASKAISELQKAVLANDTANIPAKLAAAQAAAQTKDDRYVVGQLQLKAALAAKDNAQAAAAVDAIAASGYLDAAKSAELYTAVGVQFYNAKQFPQAAASFQKASSLTPQSAEPYKMLAEALNSQGQRAEGAAALMKALQLSTASGQKPDENLYKRAVGMAYEAKSPTAVDLARQWVAAYPTADSWHNAIAIYRNLDAPDPSTAVDILRLARATNSMQGTGDYHIYAFETANQANYGEAKAVIDEGIASGKIKASDPVIQEVQGVLKGKNAPTAAELAAAEKGAAVPTAFIKVGDRYYGAKNFQKAADLYRQGLAKGADANLANLRIGEALAQAGDKAGATAALSKVSGPMAEIAKFWLLYVNRAG